MIVMISTQMKITTPWKACDGKDNDCNGINDDNAIDAFSLYEDADNDGYGDENASSAFPFHEVTSGYAENNDDCNDGDLESTQEHMTFWMMESIKIAMAYLLKRALATQHTRGFGAKFRHQLVLCRRLYRGCWKLNHHRLCQPSLAAWSRLLGSQHL